MSVSVLIFFAVLLVLICGLRYAKISALVALLFAGILSGPYVLNLFELNQTWDFLGNLGILFLWFNIGLEINIRRLLDMRRTIFGFGAAQVMMVAVMLFPMLVMGTTWSVMGCVMVSLLLAMSSTSADLQLLSDRNQLNSSVGHQTFSILLFQDLLSIPLLAMLPVFAGKTFNFGAMAIDVLVTSALLVLGVVIVGRFLLNPLLRAVSKLKSKEAFLLAIMLNIVLWAVFLDWLGLPSGLGAFLAGMMMSETVYRYQVTADISPYSMLFLSLFFISLGMGLNLPVLIDNWNLVLLGLVCLIVVKFVALFMVARVRHVAIPDASFIALILAQGGEFGLLMLQMLKSSGIDVIPIQDSEILTAIIVMSIMITPVAITVYDWLRKKGYICKSDALIKEKLTSTTNAPSVIICGFGRVGQIIAQLLKENNISYVAMDMNVGAIMQGRENGFNVVYGNSTNPVVLRECGLTPRRTRAVVLALDNAATARDAMRAIKVVAPRVKIFARARNLEASKLLLRDGATAAFPETIESTLFLGYGVLSHLGISENRIDEMLTSLRQDNYSALNGAVKQS